MDNVKLVLASSNHGKLEELRSLLSGSGIELIAQSDLGVEDAEETGTTFVENALLKARHATRITGLPALADDSGICVDALRGGAVQDETSTLRVGGAGANGLAADLYPDRRLAESV